MARRSTLQAIVARAVDVGEADRFCILFSRERGKIAVRAPGVRRVGSRMGGSLLPLRRVEVEVSESRGGLLVTAARVLDDAALSLPSLSSFSRMEQGMELLLTLTEDDHALPQVYALTAEFVTLCADPAIDPLPGFQLRLLHLLGLLPAEEHEPRFASLSQLARAFIGQVVAGASLLTLVHQPCPAQEIRQFRGALLAEHLARPLRSAHVASSLERIDL